MPTIGTALQGYYYDAGTDTLRPIVGTQGPPGNSNVTVSGAAPTGGKYGDLWCQTSTTPWTAPSTLPMGIVAWKPYSIAVSMTGSAVTLMQLTAVPLQVGRLYRLNYTLRAVGFPSAPGSTRVGTPGFTAIANTTLVVDAYVYSGSVGVWASMADVAFFTVSVATNYTISIEAVATSGGQVYPTFIAIEDIGPNRGQQ